MSRNQIRLVKHILSEHYGDIITDITIYLIKKGSSTLRSIVLDNNLKVKEAKKALVVLHHQNISSTFVNKKGTTEYMVDIQSILLRLRFPRYIYCAKTLYGDAAELIVEELLIQGRARLSPLLDQVMKRLSESLDDGVEEMSRDTVIKHFTSLVQTHFVRRCGPEQKSEKDSEDEDPSVYKVPNLNTQPGKRKSVFKDKSASKKQKTEDCPEFEDDSTYWRINYKRFHHYLRDQFFVSAIAQKIDHKAAEVLRTILRINEVKSSFDQEVTCSTSQNDIHKKFPPDLGINQTLVEQYIKVMCDDNTSFLVKTDNSGGGMYAVHTYQAVATLAQAHIENIVLERFGSKALRIFRLLIIKKNLEQKQIEEQAMIPPKEAKQIIYQMLNAHFLYITEIAKTADHAPSRTYYAFSVNLRKIARMIIEQCYKALSNLITRRKMELETNKRLLEKQQRTEAIIMSLEQQEADEEQKKEVEATITPPEQLLLKQIKKMTEQIENSELQLDDTMFILQMFITFRPD